MPMRTAFATAAATFSSAVPATAQSYIVPDVAFFERVVVGEVEVSPVAVFRDTRCADIRFCTRDDRLIVSTVLFDYRGKSEVILELDVPTYVPGGFLILREAGTRPAFRGAIPLDQYRLTLEYLPVRFEEGF